MRSLRRTLSLVAVLAAVSCVSAPAPTTAAPSNSALPVTATLSADLLSGAPAASPDGCVLRCENDVCVWIC